MGKSSITNQLNLILNNMMKIRKMTTAQGEDYMTECFLDDDNIEMAIN